MTTINVTRDEAYYANMVPFPPGELSEVDVYRFKLVRRHLVGTSVLEAGCWKGGFLRLIEDQYQISGIEANTQRADYCNQLLGGDIVWVGNLDGQLPVGDESFDTVVALEVLE